MSCGERQLISIGRAFLRRSKIVLIDEATSDIDEKMETLIMQSIKKCFKDSLVLTIAHKFKTVMESDRILVLDKGKIAEYDTPKNLQ